MRDGTSRTKSEPMRTQRWHCGQAAKRQLGLVDAVAGVDADAVGGGKADPGDGGVACLCGQLGQVVDSWVGRCTEDPVSLEGLEAQGLTARSFAIIQCSVHLTLFDGRQRGSIRHSYFWGSAWYFRVAKKCTDGGLELSESNARGKCSRDWYT
jgi:hypothetical protein